MATRRFVAALTAAALSMLGGCTNGGPAVSSQTSPEGQEVPRAPHFAALRRPPPTLAALSRPSMDRAVHHPATAAAAPNIAPVNLRPGAFPPAPQQVSGGGPVQTAPRVVPIIFAGHPFQAQIVDFLSKLVGSQYWRSATSEYGVGPLTVTPMVVPSIAAPAAWTDTDIQIWLNAQIAAGTIPLPDANTVYTFFFPPQTVVDGGSCKNFGGYHSWYTPPSQPQTTYAVIPTCDNYLGNHLMDHVTFATSHELAEAATDPFGNTYQYVNWEGTMFSAEAEAGNSAEVGDTCEFQPNVRYRDAETGGYLLSRIWSNQSAGGWHDPCLPVPVGTGPYFSTQPIVGGTALGYSQYTKGLTIPPGGEVTIPVRLYSDGPIGPWALSAVEEPNPHLTPDTEHQLSFHFDVPHGKNGDIRHLTIKRSVPDAAAPPPFLRFAILSTLGTQQNASWIVIGK